MNKEAKTNTSQSQNNNSNFSGFVPHIYLDNPVFDELLDLAKEKGIIKDTQDKKYRFRARTMLYTNFNKYLTLLLLNLDNKKMSELSKKLEKVKNLEEVSNILETNLNKNKKEILEKFFNYFK